LRTGTGGAVAARVGVAARDVAVAVAAVPGAVRKTIDRRPGSGTS